MTVSNCDATLKVQTSNGDTVYELVDAAGRILYRGRLPESIAGTIREGSLLIVMMSPTEYAAVAHAPHSIGHGFYAQAFDGRVDEVWAFGQRDGSWVWISADGRVVMHGTGGDPLASLPTTRAEAVERVLGYADGELSRARAAVDSLRAELAADTL